MSARQGEQKAQNSIIITMPAAANVQELHVEPGGSIRFGFDASTADFAREGTALLIRQQDGGTIRLTDYFIIGEEAAAAGKGAKALPDFVLPDGTVIAGQDFLASMARDMDLSTAAGPSASAPSGGGSSYDDDAGSLLVGLDRFGSLGTDFWSRGSELSEIAQSRLMPEKGAELPAGQGAQGNGPFFPGEERPGGNSVPGGAPAPAQSTEPPVEPIEEPQENIPYHTRLIVTDSSANSFSFQAVDADGTLLAYDPTRISFANPESLTYFTEPVGDPVSGLISVGLTAAGMAALKGKELASELLLIQIDGGLPYTMPLLINNDTAYDYKLEEERAEAAGDKLGPDLKAEWYAADWEGELSKTLVREKDITLGGTDYNKVQIEVETSGTGFAYGMANSHIDTRASEKSDILISAASEGGATAALLTTTASSIRGSDRGSFVVFEAAQGGKDGVYGLRTLSAKARADIEAAVVDISAGSEESSGPSFGIYASQGVNSIEATSVNIAAYGASGEAQALHAEYSGLNSIEATNVNIAAYGASGKGWLVGLGGQGLSDYAGISKNSIEASGTVDMEYHNAAEGNAYGMSAQLWNYWGEERLADNGGAVENSVTAGGAITLGVETRQGFAAGMVAYGTQGKNELRSGEGHDISVRSVSEQGTSHGLTTSHGGSNTLDSGKDVKITVTGERFVYGVHVDKADVWDLDSSTQAENRIQAAGDVSIRAASSGAIAYALYNRVDGGQKNTVLAGGDIRVEAEGVKEAVWDQGHSDAAVNRVDAAVAVYTHAGSQTLLKAEGDISVKAEVRETEAGAAQGGAFGLYAGKAARLGTDQREVENLLEANRVDVAAFSEGKAYALYADRGGDNAVHGETSGMITASATGDFGEAQALHAHWSGTNSVSAATVEIAASAAGLAGTAYGLFSDGGNNSISAGTAVISATANASSGRAYGLFAQGYGSHNTIKALEGKALAVSITAANAQEAYALWAKNYGAINRISGGDQADSVSIVGEVYAASSGQNIIETGGGNDSISLFGKVTAGALNIIAGDGFDTLILKAASLAEFNDHYKAWLDDLQLKGCIEGMGVERVEVQIEGNAEGNPGVLASELDWLKDCFASSKSIDFVLDCIVSESSAGEGISFVGGTGDDSLYLRLSGGSGDSSLFSSFLENSAISSVENLILDMDDSHTGSLELDSLLEHLPGGKLYVCGDENDAVLLGKSESWQKSDALVTHNGVQYTMYMHESENLEIYIQSSITILG